MSSSLKCTNPACQTFITVPEGALQVICPSCNTWHFPTAEEQSTGVYPSPTGSNSYEIPPAPQESAPANPQAASPVVDAYLPPNAIPHSTESAAQTNQQEAAAYLLTNTGERLILKVGKNIIGRKNTDLVIDDRTVSRRHCVIEIINKSAGIPEFFIYDIGLIDGTSSTNGVFISGRSLRLQDYERIPIGPETSIRMGMVNLVLKMLD